MDSSSSVPHIAVPLYPTQGPTTTATLIRAPLSYEDTNAAEEDNGTAGGGVVEYASDADSFLTGGDEEFGSASDRSEYLELGQEVVMPRARVSGDDEDFGEFLEEEEEGVEADGVARVGDGGGLSGVGLGLEKAGVLGFEPKGFSLEGLEEASVAQDEKGDARGKVGIEEEEEEEEEEGSIPEEGTVPGGTRLIEATSGAVEDDEEVVSAREGFGVLSNATEEPKDDDLKEVVDTIGKGEFGVLGSEEKVPVLKELEDVSVVQDERGNGGPNGVLEKKEEETIPDFMKLVEAKIGAAVADDEVVITSEGAGVLSSTTEEPKGDALKEEVVSSGKGEDVSVGIEGASYAVEAEENVDSAPSEQKFVVTNSAHELESSEPKDNTNEVAIGGYLDGTSASMEYEKIQETIAEIGVANSSKGVDDRGPVKLETRNNDNMTELEQNSAAMETNSIEPVTNLISDSADGISAELLVIPTEDSKDLLIDKEDDGKKEILNEAGEQEVKPGTNMDVVNNSAVVDDRVPVRTESENEELVAESQQGSAGPEVNQSMLPTNLTSDIGGLDNGDFEDLQKDREDVSDEGEEIDLNEPGEEEGEQKEEEGLITEGPGRIAIFECSESAKQLLKDLDDSASSSNSNAGSSRDFSNQVDGQIVTESDEEVVTDEEGDGKELFDSAALTAFLKAATGTSPDGSVTVAASNARIFSVECPAGLGSSVPSLKPALPQPMRSSLFPPNIAVVGDDNTMHEVEKKLHEKVEQVRVKFLRLVHRLGYSPDDTVAAQVLYRLGLAEGIKGGRQMGHAFSIESAKQKALKLEEDLKEDLEFSCNILVLGKTGVGKSASINSIFGDKMTYTNAFQPATTCVKENVDIVDGIRVRLIDTPGLSPSAMDQASNRKILSSIKKHIKKCAPDIVLYVDRLDTLTRDLNDLPLLRSITSALGSSIWFNAIVALTHSATAPPDGPSGAPLNYDVFVAQRSHVVQHSIRQAAGDMRLMNPVALVENHPSCRRNREGQRVLPNGTSWRSQLLLLCYSSKILSEANSLLKLKEQTPGKLFGFRLRSLPLPYLLSSLLQSRPHPKLAADQGGENVVSDIEFRDSSDSDQEEEEDEYDQLPPFKPLKKAQIAKLTKEQRNAYFDEYDYRVKLLQKKQLKEELKRVKEMKNRGKEARDEFHYGEMADDYDQDAAPAAVPVPLPDMVLPPTFDCENIAYRYRFLEPTSQLLARPVLDTNGWDHDCGYVGVSLDGNLAIAGQFPASVAVQITKDKKDFSMHLDSSVSANHGENGSSLAGFDIQSVGKQLAYILRGETKFKNLKKNKTAAGISVTFLGENIVTGLKVEDQLLIGKRLNLVASTGTIRSQGDVAYGANLEARLQEKDYPIGQDNTTVGLSLVKWRRDLALGANLQSQVSVGRNSKMALRVGLNNKLSGQITVRTSSSDQLQIALLGVLPVAMSIFRSIWPGESYLDQ